MIDRYTKVVLTVIAVCLVALVAQNTVHNAIADNYGNKCGTYGDPACKVQWDSAMPVKIKDY